MNLYSFGFSYFIVTLIFGDLFQYLFQNSKILPFLQIYLFVANYFINKKIIRKMPRKTESNFL